MIGLLKSYRMHVLILKMVTLDKSYEHLNFFDKMRERTMVIKALFTLGL